MVQWLRLCAPDVGGRWFDPWSGKQISRAATTILCATTKAWCSQKKKKKKKGSFLIFANLIFEKLYLVPFAFKIVSEMEHSYIFISQRVLCE